MPNDIQHIPYMPSNAMTFGPGTYMPNAIQANPFANIGVSLAWSFMGMHGSPFFMPASGDPFSAYMSARYLEQAKSNIQQAAFSSFYPLTNSISRLLTNFNQPDLARSLQQAAHGPIGGFVRQLALSTPYITQVLGQNPYETFNFMMNNATAFARANRPLLSGTVEEVANYQTQAMSHAANLMSYMNQRIYRGSSTLVPDITFTQGYEARDLYKLMGYMAKSGMRFRDRAGRLIKMSTTADKRNYIDEEGNIDMTSYMAENEMLVKSKVEAVGKMAKALKMIGMVFQDPEKNIFKQLANLERIIGPELAMMGAEGISRFGSVIGGLAQMTQTSARYVADVYSSMRMGTTAAYASQNLIGAIGLGHPGGPRIGTIIHELATQRTVSTMMAAQRAGVLGTQQEKTFMAGAASINQMIDTSTLGRAQTLISAATAGGYITEDSGKAFLHALGSGGDITPYIRAVAVSFGGMQNFNELIRDPNKFAMALSRMERRGRTIFGEDYNERLANLTAIQSNAAISRLKWEVNTTKANREAEVLNNILRTYGYKPSEQEAVMSSEDFENFLNSRVVSRTFSKEQIENFKSKWQDYLALHPKGSFGEFVDIFREQGEFKSLFDLYKPYEFMTRYGEKTIYQTEYIGSALNILKSRLGTQSQYINWKEIEEAKKKIPADHGRSYYQVVKKVLDRIKGADDFDKLSVQGRNAFAEAEHLLKSSKTTLKGVVMRGGFFDISDKLGAVEEEVLKNMTVTSQQEWIAMRKYSNIYKGLSQFTSQGLVRGLINFAIGGKYTKEQLARDLGVVSLQEIDMAIKQGGLSLDALIGMGASGEFDEEVEDIASMIAIDPDQLEKDMEYYTKVYKGKRKLSARDEKNLRKGYLALLKGVREYKYSNVSDIAKDYGKSLKMLRFWRDFYLSLPASYFEGKNARKIKQKIEEIYEEEKKKLGEVSPAERGVVLQEQRFKFERFLKEESRGGVRRLEAGQLKTSKGVAAEEATESLPPDGTDHNPVRVIIVKDETKLNKSKAKVHSGQTKNTSKDEDENEWSWGW